MTLSVFTDFNVDLLFVGLSAAAIGLIGFVVYLNNRQSQTAKSFLFFAVLTILWNFTNFFQYKFNTIPVTLWLLRINLFVATWHAFSFFRLSYFFPEIAREKPKWYRALFGITLIVSLLTLTPFVFKSIETLASPGSVTNPERGPGIAVFSVVALGLLALGLYELFKKWRLSGAVQKIVGIVFFAMSVTAFLIICFNVVLPVVFNTLIFLPFTGLLMVPFIGLVSYAIYRHQLFSLKVVAVEALVFILGAITFVEVIFTQSPLLLVIRSLFFLLIIGASVLLTQSVIREVEQRETIQKQEQELEIANRQQESLLHFISHEIKGYLTKGQNAFAGIIEGDYGAVAPSVKALSIGALHEMRKGVSMVMDILDASNYKKGTMTFENKAFDIKKAILELSDEMRFMAEEKGLQFEVTFAPSGEYLVTGDEIKIRRHVLRNVIENSIRYTIAGKVTVSLSRIPGYIRFTVTDTGVGITTEDMSRLFTQGGKGRESIKVNVDSTGYGLFVAKQVMDAHKGKIQAHSDGAGKGSTFTVDFPAA